MFLDPIFVCKRISAPCLLEGCLVIISLRILDALLNVLLEVPYQTLDGPGSGIAQSTDGVALDLSADLLEHWNFPLVGVALLHADEDVLQPGGTLTAGSALPARFVLVEVRQPADGGDHIDGVIEHGHRGGAKTGAAGAKVVELHDGLVAVILVQDGNGRSAGDAGLDGVPAVAHATAVLLDELAEGDGHALLYDDGVLHVAGDGEQLGAAVVLVTERGEPVGTTTEDGGTDGDGLDVGDGGGAAEDADAGGERRLETGLALSALEALDEGRLLSADVGARSAVEEDVEVVSRSAGVATDEAGGVGLVDGLVEDDGLVEVFATDVDVGGTGAHGVTGEEAALDELVRVLSHDLPILAGAGLGLVGVDDKEGGPTVGLLGHEGPLEAGGEAGAAAAAEAGVLDLLDDPVGSLPHDLLGHLVVSALEGILEAPVLLAVEVGEDAILVGEAAVGAVDGDGMAVEWRWNGDGKGSKKIR